MSLETRDAADGQIKPGMSVADLAGMDTKVAHPLTGPVYVGGAKPGDLLEIEYLIVPEPYGWTRVRPGAGFLRDLFPEPYLAHWHMAGGYATSPQLPGVRIPESSFMGSGRACAFARGTGQVDGARSRSRTPRRHGADARSAGRSAP